MKCANSPRRTIPTARKGTTLPLGPGKRLPRCGRAESSDPTPAPAQRRWPRTTLGQLGAVPAARAAGCRRVGQTHARPLDAELLESRPGVCRGLAARGESLTKYLTMTNTLVYNCFMAMGRRNRRQRQKDLWIAAADLPHTAHIRFITGSTDCLTSMASTSSPNSAVRTSTHRAWVVPR